MKLSPFRKMTRAVRTRANAFREVVLSYGGGTHAKSSASAIAVELDTASPAQLRAALREAIEAIIEPVAWAAAQDREAALAREVRAGVRAILAAADADR